MHKSWLMEGVGGVQDIRENNSSLMANGQK